MRAYERIISAAHECADNTNILTDNGILFVKKIGSEQKLRYLHKIFPKNTNNDNFITVAGFEAPRGYDEFLSECGGCILFDSVMHLFGLDKSLSRSVDLDDQRPVYIGTPQIEFSSERPDEFMREWRPVGVIVANNQIWMTINSTGESALMDSSRLLRFSSFDHMIDHIISVLISKIGCGPFREERGTEIEETMFMA
ncbi:hypothetical protein [Sphingomonas sp. OTU376]|uniref:hypothetical protein n=1 Tax=Sphingomonas sp. OTU376 TaxID=3043863 RepID=UPI00313D70E9